MELGDRNANSRDSMWVGLIVLGKGDHLFWEGIGLACYAATTKEVVHNNPQVATPRKDLRCRIPLQCSVPPAVTGKL